MTTVRDRQLPLVLVAALLAGSAAAAQDLAEPHPALAQPSPEPAPTAPEQVDDIAGIATFMRVAGSTFTPRGSTATYSYWGGGCMQRDSNVGDSWFTTSIELPNGSEIDFLRVYYRDADATYNINSELWAFDGAGGTTLIAEADSSGSPGFSSAGSDFFSHVVDNTSQSLVVVASIQGGVGDTLQLCGIRLRYQVPISDVIFQDGFEL